MPIQNKFEKKVPTMSSDIARWPVIEKKIEKAMTIVV
jgi:hypothetical protein